jgi:hypothetical protein
MDAWRDPRVRFAGVAALGAASMLLVQVAGIVIGIGALGFVPLTGFGSALLVPTGAGWLVFIVAMAVTVAVVSVVGTGGSLWPLVIVLMGLLATSGWLAGYAVARARRTGLRAALRDGRAIGAALASVAVAASFVWIMAALSSNPA